MGVFKTAINIFAILMITEFLLIGFYFLVTGALSGGPLPAVSAFCTNSGITAYELGIAVFIIGTILNIMVCVPAIILFGGNK